MRTVILGIGAQKTASTWLFKQIFKSDNFCHGLCKEYHLFDVLYLNGMEKLKHNVAARINNYPLKRGDDFVQSATERMFGFYEDKAQYFNYFDAILTEENSFSSDITPSYAGLPSDAFSDIKAGFKQRNINVKVVFIMREPISRLESALKMSLKRNKTLEHASSDRVMTMLKNELNADFDTSRSNYEYTCQQLDKVFSPDEIFYGFYESLFNASEIDRLSQFIGVPTALFNTDRVINRSQKRFQYKAKDVLFLKEKVKHKYEFVEKRFNFDLSWWHDETEKMIDDSL